ncbi:MAG: DUF4293 family protein [Sphingobacteriia bacterium]|nr:DUF4293 family protein [Sphingobacteriia bacterium]
MLQRIQTIYLLIVVILTSITFFLPILSFTSGAEAYQLDFAGLSQLQGDDFAVIDRTWALTIYMALIPLIALATICFYQRRIVQIRLSVFNIVLMIGFYGMIWLNGSMIESQIETKMSFEYTTAFPLVSAIFTYLAIRAIGKDEALVHAADRLRPTKK